MKSDGSLCVSRATEMVRSSIGARRFLRVLDGLVTFAPGCVSFADLRALIAAESGPAGARALDDWFGKAGVPRLRVTLRVMDAAGGGHRADIRIEQTSGAYAIPVDVVLIGAGVERRETISISATPVRLRSTKDMCGSMSWIDLPASCSR